MSEFLNELTGKAPLIFSFLLAMAFHEAAHAFVADRLGDATPRLSGRLTLNPLAHLDLIGFIAILIAPIGWAKPVPVNPGNFRNPRWGLLKVSIAGPASNLLLAAAMALAFRWLADVRLVGASPAVDR
ncbi:MAG TPA: site-2 protease family protein, partial [Geobacteraceae bacterium]